MMALIRLSLALFLPILIGYSILSAIIRDRDMNSLERSALSVLIGTGALSLSMLLFGIIRVPLEALNISVFWAMVIGMLFIKALRNKVKVFDLSGLAASLLKITEFKWYELALLSLIGLKVAYVFFGSLIKPVWGCDSFTIWSLRAKVFFYESGLSLGKARGYFLGDSKIDYPLNMPLMQTWIAKVLGSWDDVLVKIIFPLFFACFIIIFYYSLRKYIPRFQSLLGTYLLTALPLLVFHATVEYSDLIVGIYFISGYFFLLRYIKENDLSDAVIFSVLSCFAAWTKNEGLMLCLVNMLLLILYVSSDNNLMKQRARSVYVYFASLFAIALPWYFVRVALRVPTYGDQVPNLSKMFEYAPRIPVIINTLYNKAMFYGQWSICWFVFIVALVLSFRDIKRPQNYYTLAAISLSFIAYFLIYYLTNSYAFLVDGTAVNRNTLTYMPLLVFYIALCFSRGALKNDGNGK